jgi:hypothetical protein
LAAGCGKLDAAPDENALLSAITSWTSMKAVNPFPALSNSISS